MRSNAGLRCHEHYCVPSELLQSTTSVPLTTPNHWWARFQIEPRPLCASTTTPAPALGETTQKSTAAHSKRSQRRRFVAGLAFRLDRPRLVKSRTRRIPPLSFCHRPDNLEPTLPHSSLLPGRCGAVSALRARQPETAFPLLVASPPASPPGYARLPATARGVPCFDIAVAAIGNRFALYGTRVSLSAKYWRGGVSRKSAKNAYKFSNVERYSPYGVFCTLALKPSAWQSQ